MRAKSQAERTSGSAPDPVDMCHRVCICVRNLSADVAMVWGSRNQWSWRGWSFLLVNTEGIVRRSMMQISSFVTVHTVTVRLSIFKEEIYCMMVTD